MGLPLALLAGRVVRDQLYGVGPGDWPTIVVVAGFMTVVVAAAALVPAVQAAHIDPARVLQHEAAD
jgi:hypothetical protein